MPPPYAIYSRSGTPLETEVGLSERICIVNEAQERSEPQRAFLYAWLQYALHPNSDLYPVDLRLSRVPFGQPSSLHPFRR
ncbi:MAG: hypothetical protein R3B95_08555 [Nitrospirales bacterium]|nr:hypothetical protein [Nitrospirales bacterium]